MGVQVSFRHVAPICPLPPLPSFDHPPVTKEPSRPPFPRPSDLWHYGVSEGYRRPFALAWDIPSIPPNPLFWDFPSPNP